VAVQARETRMCWKYGQGSGLLRPLGSSEAGVSGVCSLISLQKRRVPTFRASRGLHCKAVRKHATLPLCELTDGVLFCLFGNLALISTKEETP